MTIVTARTPYIDIIYTPYYSDRCTQINTNRVMEPNGLSWLVTGLMGITTTAGVYWSLKLHKKTSKRYSTLRTKQPMDICDFKKTKHMIGDVVILRVDPDIPTPASQNENYYSNYAHFCMPDERQYVDDMVKTLNETNTEKVWTGRDIYSYESQVQFKGLGKLHDGVLQVDVKPVRRNDDLSFWGEIYQYLALHIQRVISLVVFTFTSRYKDSLFVKGANIGFLEVNYNWFVGHILVECEIGDLQKPLQVRSVSLSQHVLIDSAAEKLSLSLKSLLSWSVVWGLSMFVLRYLYKAYSTRLRRVPAAPLLKTELAFQSQSDSTTCIICMSNNRNVVFSACRHLLICHTCLRYLPQPACVLCKIPFQPRIVYNLR